MSNRVPADDAYDRGLVAGEIAARLADHDKHFANINGSMEKVASELHALALGVQRLADSAASDRATVITTAAALKAAEDARRTQSDTSWTPWQRIAVIVGALTALATAGVLIAVNVR